jgi:hypothetical protein
MKAIHLIAVMLLLLLLGLAAPSLMAQSLVSGDITGTVTDPSGAVVPGAAVSLKSDATGATRATTTNATGAYRFALLPPGKYTVSVTGQGFNKTEAPTTVTVGQATVADIKLSLGTTSQNVEVSSSVPLVQAENADLSINFNQALIANEPNGGNDITYIAQTAPGVNMNTGGGFGNFQTSGLPATSNLFTVNGENNQDPYLNLNTSGATNLSLGKNDVEEATVVTNAYSGQYGQQAGAQVSYVTKSGSNQFHGNVEYWWTGRALNANDYFNNLDGTPRPFANNNQWAASLGGPIKKDKLFFFVDSEGVRYIVPSSAQVFAPTVGFANATLANIAAVSPASLPLYQKAFSLYEQAPGYNRLAPLSNGTTGCLDLSSFAGNCFGQYGATPALPGTEYIISGRVDYNLSDKDHLFWRVRMDHGTQATYADPINPAFNAASYQPAYDGQGQWTHSFGSNATNQLVYAGSYYRAIFTQTNGANSVFPLTLDLAPLGYTNLGQFLFNFPQGRNVTQYQFVDDFSWTKGNHSLKFGANFRRYDLTDYTFSALTNPLAVFAGPTGLSDFFNGSAAVFLQNFPTRSTEPIALWGLGAYAQDEWRVNKSLKLTLALRLEHNSNPNCNLNCSSFLAAPFSATSTDPNTPFNQMIRANQGGAFRGTDAVNIAPRFGFAWSPGGSEKTVVRGGFGIFYDAFPSIYGDNSFTNVPNEISQTLFGVPWADQTTPAGAFQIASSSAAAIRNGFANGASFNSLSAAVPGFAAPGFNTLLGTFKSPRYQEWSLQLQQALDDKSSVTLAYVGNHGIHIPITNFPNAFAGVAGLPAAALNPSFSTVQEVYSGAVSNFNGLTASYQRRLTYGFTVNASFTWSHALDEVSNNGSPNTPYNINTSIQYQINPSCLHCNNYGNADYDFPRSFNAQYVWNTPWKFGNRYANGALGGWTLSQNFFARSGLPLTVLDSTSNINNYNGGTPNFPALVIGNGQGSCNQFGQGCLNAAGFGPVGAAGTFPTQVRNQFRGPGFFDTDLSVNKSFKMTERVALGIGANFYNVLNHPNFSSPVSAFGAGNFGQSVATTAPPTGPYGAFFSGLPSGRIIQFQGKIIF